MPSPSWLNENENRAYPLVVGASGPPHALLVDAGFVVGPRARFETGTHTIFLAGVRRSGATFYIDFASDAPELYGLLLTFERAVGGPDFAGEFADTGEAGRSASSDSGSVSGSDSLARRLCDEPLWYGFAVTGRMAAFAALLPGDGAVAFARPVEPALIQNLGEAYVTQFAVANVDRTRVSPAANCPGDSTDQITHTNATCVTGAVVLVPGYNASVRQTAADNSITLGAVVGGGAGEPCEPVKTYAAEAPLAGSGLLEGGPRCNQTLRAVNGVGGPLLTLIAGAGVTITAVPEEFKLVVTVDMTGLALCYDAVSARSESC